MPEPFEHRLSVRYAETDQMGRVYHANYLVYMEEARTKAMASIGCAYDRLEREGWGLVVRKADVRYRAAAAYGDDLVVRTFVERVRGASILFRYEIERAEDGLRVAEGSTELACIDLRHPERGPTMLPAELRRALER